MTALASADIRKGTRAVGQHSSATDDWGTEPRIIGLERQVLGRIGVDPASSLKWNQIVGAERIITKRENGVTTSWFPGAPKPNALVGLVNKTLPQHQGAGDTCHANPPGDASGENVATYWCAMTGYHALGWMSAGIWIGFSVEQLSRLQRVGAASHPLLHVTCIPEQRRRYSVKPGVSGNQPGHASFITLLPSSREQVRKFVALFSDLGHVIVGDRWRR